MAWEGRVATASACGPVSAGVTAMRRKTLNGNAQTTLSAWNTAPPVQRTSLLAPLSSIAVTMVFDRTSRCKAAAIASGMRCTPLQAVKPTMPGGVCFRWAMEKAARLNMVNAETSWASRP